MYMWLRYFKIFIDATLNSPARVGSPWHQNHISSYYRSNFNTFRPKLQIFVWLRDFRIFTPARVDTPRHQNHISSLYRSNFSPIMPKLQIFVWLRDFMISIDAPLNFPTRIETPRHQNHVSSLYWSNFSSKFKLKIQPHARNAEGRTFTSKKGGKPGIRSYQ